MGRGKVRTGLRWVASQIASSISNRRAQEWGSKRKENDISGANDMQASMMDAGLGPVQWW